MDSRRADARKFDLAEPAHAAEPALFERAPLLRAPSAAPRTLGSQPRDDARVIENPLEELVAASGASDPTRATRLLGKLSDDWDPADRVFIGGGGPGQTEFSSAEQRNARALWALGTAIDRARDSSFIASARALFEQVLPSVADAECPRALAFAMLGAAAFLRRHPGHAASANLLEQGGALFHHLLAPERRPSWSWFEAVLSSDYGRVPEALIAAGETLARADWRACGRRTQAWIAQQS